MTSNIKQIQKLAYIENTVIAALVFVMMAIYYFIGATFLVYYSIFVAIVYIAHYYLIRKYQFIKVTWSTYAMLTLYMFICTIFLGYDYGFQLYSMSTIPLIYYIKYISEKFGGEDPKPGIWSIIIVISCLVSSLYSVWNGPIYHIEGIPAITFLGLNLCSVFFFLIGFSQVTTKLIIDSEKKLKNQANYDALTGLANRYSMASTLKQAIQEDNSKPLWIAMLDIDDFKKINDQYGHAAGDQVLKKLAKIMKQTCDGCNISRWGGEEFLIFSNNAPREILEDLIKQVEEASIITKKGTVKFTISVGEASFQPGQSIDSWINHADKMLYYGKNNGKNQVNYE